MYLLTAHSLFRLPPLPPTEKVRSYLRNRAGLPPAVAGAGNLNQGHRALYERELLLLHNVLPKDADIRDGLQLIDGADVNRHLGVSVPSPVPATGTGAPDGQAPDGHAGAPNAQVPSTAATPIIPPPMAQPGVELPTPPHAMNLVPLPAGMPIIPGSQASREAERAAGRVAQESVRTPQGDWDEEEDDEIRPVSDEYAAQWRAYYAARR